MRSPAIWRGGSVSGDHVQVGMPVLVLQEGVVEVVRLCCLPQRSGCPAELVPKVVPFCGCELIDGHDMAACDQLALAEEVLAAVEHKPPEHAVSQHRAQLF